MLLEEHSGQTVLFTPDGEPQQVNYLTRIDPFTGNVAKISEERARRTIGISAELQIRPVENCVFCAFEENTPKERIEHTCGAISVPNRYPWEKYDWITINPPFTQHKLFLSDLDFEDLERMMESAYDLAGICAQDPEVISFMDFTNWGVFAGASQQHPRRCGRCTPTTRAGTHGRGSARVGSCARGSTTRMESGPSAPWVPARQRRARK